MKTREIQTVTVLGAGTMGSGIAAACATAGIKTILLDVTSELAERGKESMLTGRAPMLDDPESANLVLTGSFDELGLVANSDWICEAVVENLEAKQSIFKRVESVRKDGSIVTTNTSGIPLRSICDGMPERFRKDVAVTHFFNPVKVMRLLEVVSGEDTTDDVIESLVQFVRTNLRKGVVYAKDTVNFIGNRIGCFWMLAGLHTGRTARANGLSIENIDTLTSKAFGAPSTGLYGLIDLVGLDVMSLVAGNLRNNLPENDAGRQYLDFPPEEQAMLDSGQLGRKTGGGFYRMNKQKDGSRIKQMYQLESGGWSELSGSTGEYRVELLARSGGDENKEANFVWSLLSETLCYAADLVPEISNDIVNVDRAMRWGFNWKKGPFELLDELGPNNVINWARSEKREIPTMLQVLSDYGAPTFYRSLTGKDGIGYLGIDGNYYKVPVE